MKKKGRISLPKEDPEPEPGKNGLILRWFHRKHFGIKRAGTECLSPLEPSRWERGKLI